MVSLTLSLRSFVVDASELHEGTPMSKNMGPLMGNHVLFRKLNKKNDKPTGLALLFSAEWNF